MKELFPEHLPALEGASLPAGLSQLGASLPRGLRMGTSSWSFPGWEGLVWGRSYPQGVLARDGLGAYASHPLFRTVGVDRTWYAPVGADVFARYARQVPGDFRFLVKAPAVLLTPARGRGADTDRYLNPAFALDAWIDPVRRGLGEKVGTLLLQFPPFPPEDRRDPEQLADALDRFFAALPKGLPYAVELRHRSGLTRPYAQVLARHRVHHCLNVYPGMPTLSTQDRVAAATGMPGRIVRWMLHPGFSYQQAKEAFAPFQQLAAPQDDVLNDLVDVLHPVLQSDEAALVIVNNKAEGCSPLTIQRLARALLLRQAT